MSLAVAIAPIVQTVQVKAPPTRAFALFVHHMADWWTRGQTPGRLPHVDLVVEPHPGGRWFERDAEGHETQWGRVLAWEPPGRVLLAWQLDCTWRHDPAFETEVELTFTPATGGGTLVRLEHRHLERFAERFGEAAVGHTDRIGNGWPKKMAEFAEYAERAAE